MNQEKEDAAVSAALAAQNKMNQKKQPKLDISKKEVEDFVIEQVLSKMNGKPEGFYKMRASNVFDNNWRVDIWCTQDSGEDSFSRNVLIDYSYFIRADSTGKILNSSPSIN